MSHGFLLFLGLLAGLAKFLVDIQEYGWALVVSLWIIIIAIDTKK